MACALIVTVLGCAILAPWGAGPFPSRPSSIPPKVQALRMAADPDPATKPSFRPPEENAVHQGVLPAPSAYHWNFNTPGFPKELIEVEGRWRHIPGGGPDGSGCIEMEQDFLAFTFDIPLERLPVEIRFVNNQIYNGRPEATFSNGVFWTPCPPLVQFLGLGKERVRRLPANVRAGDLVGPWIHCRQFIRFQAIDRWVQGRRRGLTIFEGRTHTRLRLLIRGQQRLDDLRLIPLAERDCPNIDLLLNAIERIPLAKRMGVVSIPELRLGKPSKTVRAGFFHADTPSTCGEDVLQCLPA